MRAMGAERLGSYSSRATTPLPAPEAEEAEVAEAERMELEEGGEAAALRGVGAGCVGGWVGERERERGKKREPNQSGALA